MVPRRLRPLAGLLASCGAMLLWAVGCVHVYSSTQLLDRWGAPVNEEFLAAVKPGETTKEQVVEGLGPPHRSMNVGDGKELLVYSCAEATTSGKTVVLVFQEQHRTTRAVEVCFELKDDVVARWWKAQVP